jgi:hypothetical protein
MAEPIAKRQRIDAAAEVCAQDGCEDLQSAARTCCLPCLSKLANAEPPLSREVIESAVQHVADRSNRWRLRKATTLRDCCGSLDILLTAAADATVVKSEPVDLSCEVGRACETGCLNCTFELLKYVDAHLGHTRYATHLQVCTASALFLVLLTAYRKLYAAVSERALVMLPCIHQVFQELEQRCARCSTAYK